MSSNEKELKFNFEQEMHSIDGVEHGIPVPSMSRHAFLAGGTAVGASLLLGRMALAENLGGIAGPPLKESSRIVVYGLP